MYYLFMKQTNCFEHNKGYIVIKECNIAGEMYYWRAQRVSMEQTDRRLDFERKEGAQRRESMVFVRVGAHLRGWMIARLSFSFFSSR